MKKSKIAIIDTGSANLHSVLKACKKVGTNVSITSNKKDLYKSDGIIFPGVGSSDAVMNYVEKNNLIDTITNLMEKGHAFLNICLGMQVLFNSSEEGNKKGLGFIDGEVKKLKDTDRFLAFGVDMVIAGYSGDEVRDILNTTIESTYGRNSVQAKILMDMGANAPAFGMIGTLVGLVIMLGNLSDPEALGPSLSIALITTLYGVMFARLLFMPAGSKVQQREDIVRFRNYLVAEGLVLLADQKSPRFIQDKMNSFLDPALHFDIDTMKDQIKE